MIKKVYVPKYIYPIATILSNYVIFLISLLVLVVVSLALGVYPTAYIFTAVIPLFIILVMAVGVGLCLSTLAVFFRGYGVPVGRHSDACDVLLCDFL